jgi:hypothetical protein
MEPAPCKATNLLLLDNGLASSTAQSFGAIKSGWEEPNCPLACALAASAELTIAPETTNVRHVFL